MNLYGFAGGDPVNFSDPFGLCKLHSGFFKAVLSFFDPPCATADDAARQGMRSVYSKSVKENREYAGEVVRLGAGKFVYTEGQGGTVASSPVDVGISGYAGFYHSHGADSHGKYDDEHFSGAGGDEEIADRTGKPRYVVTPKGAMLRYDPDPKKKPLAGTVTSVGSITP